MTAYIGLGSNLNDPEAQVRKALAAIGQLPDSKVLVSSSLYRSQPMGPQDQPNYVNAVVAIQTELTAEDLLTELQTIESKQGRERSHVRWGPRTLDLDLLCFGEQTIVTSRLTVPHSGLHERVFVLCPLAEIAPQLQVPGKGALSELLTAIDCGGLERVDCHE